jgi:hypothetical protein
MMDHEHRQDLELVSKKALGFDDDLMSYLCGTARTDHAGLFTANVVWPRIGWHFSLNRCGASAQGVTLGALFEAVFGSKG